MEKYLEKLIKQYKNQKPINFANIKSISESDIIKLVTSSEKITDNLNELVVLKLNGGLGTSMGCVGPKSLMEIKDGYNFLDITINQIKVLNEKYNVNIPLVFMNSTNTDKVTIEHCKEYSGVDIYHFNQNFLPRLDQEFNCLSKEITEDNKHSFYPPGHGDVYQAFYSSNVFKKLKNLGKKYVFISNCDNLGATVNENILNQMIDKKLDFCLEVVEKTLADVKGGTFISDNNKIKLLEVAQVPKENLDEFYDIKKFKYFNTNNLWITMDGFEKEISMEVIYNPKKVNDVDVVQLEIAMGSAIQSFDNSRIILVDRSRFRPVKKYKDYYLIQSNIFKLDDNFNLSNTLDIPKFEFDMTIKDKTSYQKYIEKKVFW